MVGWLLSSHNDGAPKKEFVRQYWAQVLSHNKKAVTKYLMTDSDASFDKAWREHLGTALVNHLYCTTHVKKDVKAELGIKKGPASKELKDIILDLVASTDDDQFEQKLNSITNPAVRLFCAHSFYLTFIMQVQAALRKRSEKLKLIHAGARAKIGLVSPADGKPWSDTTSNNAESENSLIRKHLMKPNLVDTIFEIIKARLPRSLNRRNLFLTSAY
jgi:hypothetical protein